jgi:hypothetical protein
VCAAVRRVRGVRRSCLARAGRSAVLGAARRLEGRQTLRKRAGAGAMVDAVMVCAKVLWFSGSVTNHLKGLILAQNERWWRGLGMQVVREPSFGRGRAANGVVRRRDVPSGPG